jgi:NADH:ubiquinone oxidoreductase subunit 3 (subunit A)
MKKFVLLIFFTALSMVSFALHKDSANAVTMAAYEQRWLDAEGTISLRNNTDKPIENVYFMITYLDMKGNEKDYKTFAYKIDIEPGKTKELDIPAYEHERFYHYYKTLDDYGHPAFKIRYSLKGYNLSKEEIRELNYDKGNIDSIDNDFAFMSIGFIIFAILFIIFITCVLYVVVAMMAKHRHRSVVLWLLLSFIATPLLIILILLIVGNNDNYYLNED